MRDPAVDEYVLAVTEVRRPAVAALREACIDDLGGFTESMAYGMPSYARADVIEVAFANRKQYISLYVRTDVVAAHRDRLHDLDVGKSCIRYRRPNDIEMDVVHSMMRATVSSSDEVR